MKYCSEIFFEIWVLLIFDVSKSKLRFKLRSWVLDTLQQAGHSGRLYRRALIETSYLISSRSWISILQHCQYTTCSTDHARQEGNRDISCGIDFVVKNHSARKLTIQRRRSNTVKFPIGHFQVTPNCQLSVDYLARCSREVLRTGGA